MLIYWPIKHQKNVLWPDLILKNYLSFLLVFRHLKKNNAAIVLMLVIGIMTSKYMYNNKPTFHWPVNSLSFERWIDRSNRFTQKSQKYLMPDKTAKPDIFGKKLYSFQLLRKPAILFDPRSDLLPSVCGFGQQIRSRVKQNCCGPRNQSNIFFLLYTLIFQKFSY